MRGHLWEDTLNIPIIENKATEDDIADVIEQAVRDNLRVDAVLIRRHGLYVWGDEQTSLYWTSPGALLTGDISQTQILHASY